MVMVPALAIFRSSIPCFCSISVFAVSRLLTCPINYTLILGCSMPSQNVFPPCRTIFAKAKREKIIRCARIVWGCPCSCAMAFSRKMLGKEKACRRQRLEARERKEEGQEERRNNPSPSTSLPSSPAPPSSHPSHHPLTGRRHPSRSAYCHTITAGRWRDARRPTEPGWVPGGVAAGAAAPAGVPHRRGHRPGPEQPTGR